MFHNNNAGSKYVNANLTISKKEIERYNHHIKKICDGYIAKPASENLEYKDYCDVVSEEEIYNLGLLQAVSYLKILNKTSRIQFFVLDWVYSDDYDVNLYAYITNDDIDESSKQIIKRNISNIYEKVNKAVYVSFPTNNTLVLKVVNYGSGKTDDYQELVNHIYQYVRANFKKSIISIDEETIKLICNDLCQYQY